MFMGIKMFKTRGKILERRSISTGVRNNKVKGDRDKKT